MDDQKKKAKKKNVPGPKPKKLKITDSWQEAIKKSLAKKKPLEGWPK